MGQGILVTGPSRSGKSEWAEHLASQQGLSVVYLATGQEDPSDPDWQARIERHRRRRPDHWQTRCVLTDLGAVLQSLQAQHPPVCGLVDSLGGWVANGLTLSDGDWEALVQAFLTALRTVDFPVILVAEETGWGVIPAYPLGRLFRDRLGHVIRLVGAECEKVYLVTGGYAVDLTQFGERLPIADQG